MIIFENKGDHLLWQAAHRREDDSRTPRSNAAGVFAFRDVHFVGRGLSTVPFWKWRSFGRFSGEGKTKNAEERSIFFAAEIFVSLAFSKFLIDRLPNFQTFIPDVFFFFFLFSFSFFSLINFRRYPRESSAKQVRSKLKVSAARSAV